LNATLIVESDRGTPGVIRGRNNQSRSRFFGTINIFERVLSTALSLILDTRFVNSERRGWAF
jgi:hypothetical protein